MEKTNTRRKGIGREQVPDPIRGILQRLGLSRSSEAQALGLDRGAYLQAAHEQIEALMRSDQPEHIRYYAWLIRQSIGYALEPHSTNKKTGALRYHGRVAMKLERGRKKLATLSDAARDLFMERQNVNRAHNRIEEMRWARKATLKDGSVALLCYIRPISAAKNKRKRVISPDYTPSASGTFTITYTPANCNYKIRFDLKSVISPDYRPNVEAVCMPVIQEMVAAYAERLEAALRQIPVISPEQKVSSDLSTAIRKKGTERKSAAIRQQQPAAAAAPPSEWPLALKAARQVYPKVGPGFIRKIAAGALKERPGVTDQELSAALVKKPGQASEGLWVLTVPEAMRALNQDLKVLTPREILDQAIAEEKNRK